MTCARRWPGCGCGWNRRLWPPICRMGRRHEIGSALMDIDAISGIFDAILRLGRLQSGMVARPEALVDLVGIARLVCELLQAPAEDAGHALAALLPPAPILVRGDEGLLTQALTNLVVNAIEHCPPPARITITAALQGGQAVLSVSDNGPGIPEADRARVLQRFVRLDASRSVPGTGLGLVLSHRGMPRCSHPPAMRFESKDRSAIQGIFRQSRPEDTGRQRTKA